MPFLTFSLLTFSFVDEEEEEDDDDDEGAEIGKYYAWY